jgi:hypothetical protein
MIRQLLGVVGFVAAITPVQAQCPRTAPGFGPGGVGGTISDLLTVDLGSGPRLYAAGNFAAIGDAVATGVARFDGSTWSALGAGIDVSSPDVLSPAMVSRLVAVDFGGPKVCALGSFHSAGGQSARGVALWDGASWDVLGGGPIPPPGQDLSLLWAAVFDDGSGPRLFVGGSLRSEGGTDPYLACWNGTAWTAVADAPTADPCDPGGHGYCERFGSINGLAAFDDGAELALFVAGDFDRVAGVPGFNFARWNGSTWSLPGGGIGGSTGLVRAMVLHDDGGGSALYLQGTLTGAPDPRVVRWNGTRFSALGVSPALVAGEFASLPGFAGAPAGLWLVANRPDAGSIVRASRWDGASWVSFDYSLDYYGGANALGVFDSGSGPELFVGGGYHRIGNAVAAGIAAFDGTAWHGFGSGLGFTSEMGLPGYVAALAVHDDGSGSTLYAAGQLVWTGGNQVANLVRWSGSQWQPIPGETLPYLNFIRKLISADVGQGPSLYMAGNIKIGNSNPVPFARWDGQSITAMGTMLDVFDLAVFDAGTGPKLYAASPASLLRLDGAYFTTVYSQASGDLRALAVHDDGTGPALYVAGRFASFGGVSCTNIVRYDGSMWSAVGSGVGGAGYTHIDVLRSHDDGRGAKLYAGGTFTDAGGVAVSNLAAWDGSAWADVSGGVGGTPGVVYALESFDDGQGGGDALFVGGQFTSAGGASAANLAKWNGSSWSAAGLGTLGRIPTVRTLLSVELPSLGGRTLTVGGDFEVLGDVPSQRFGRIEPCDSTGAAYCFGDGSATPCPCANSGAPGHGCQNSASTGGALLASTGSTSPDTIVLHVSGELTHSLTIFLQGNTTLSPGLNFGDGLRCAGGNLKRLYAKNASGGSASAPGPGDLSISARSAALGDAIAPGHRRYYQAYYRDGNPGFCPNPPGSSFNASNGLKIDW